MGQRRTGRQAGNATREATRRGTVEQGTGRTRGATQQRTQMTEADPGGSTRGRTRHASVEGVQGTGTKVKSGSVEAKSSLRSKFMKVMMGLTGVTMIAMGVWLTITSTLFMQGISMHKGIEIAKMTASLVRARMDAMGGTGLDQEKKDQLAVELRQYMTSASLWKDGESLTDLYSDILSIHFNNGPLSGISIKGEVPKNLNLVVKNYSKILVPRAGNVSLDTDIEVIAVDRDYGEEPSRRVYRYKVMLPGSNGEGLGDIQMVMDVDAAAIQKVNFNLYLLVGIGVLAAMLLVVFIGYNFSKKITKPVNILVRDMQMVSRGDLNHRTKPHSNDEIGVLAHEFNRMTSNLKTAQEAMVEQEKAAYELNVAHEVQQQLLPAKVPTLANFEIASYYIGARAVSGDYFDFIPLGEGIWGFIIADVSGKGIPGSMVMAQTRTVFRLVANQHPDRASETLKKTNRLIARQIKKGMFVTAFYAILNENTGQITYSSAGHNPLIIYRAATKTYELATPKGIAIGFNEGPLFDKNIQEESAVLQPGDSFVLYTDGFPEAMNENEEEFGDDEFYQVVAQTGHLPAGQMKDAIVQAIEDHRGRAAQSDDLTLIAVKRKA